MLEDGIIAKTVKNMMIGMIVLYVKGLARRKKMNEDIGLYACIVALVVMFIGFGFWGGRLYERHWWKEAIPQQMSQLCLECSRIGDNYR